MKSNKFKINIRYGYDELYPKEEHEIEENGIDDNQYHIAQVGDCNFETMTFYPEVGDNFNFKFNEEFEVEHDIIVGLPVYITIYKLEVDGMKTLQDLGYQKSDTIIIDQYTYEVNSHNVAIEHRYSEKDQKGTWTYFGGSIWDTPPTFKSLEELIEYIERSRKMHFNN